VRPLFPLSLSQAVAVQGGRVLLGPVDLRLEGRGVCAVIGPNGAGKTTLLRLLHGLTRLGGGAIRWACPTAEARRHQVFVFQQPVILRRSVRGNLAYPLALRGMARARIEARVHDWAGRVGLTPLLERPAVLLSGGEQQKLALARALITSPRLLFLDEPCAALDGHTTREIEAILMQAKRAGTQLILATHDMGQVRRLADEVVFLLGGRVHTMAAAPAFFAHPPTPQARAFLDGEIVE